MSGWFYKKKKLFLKTSMRHALEFVFKYLNVFEYL